MTANQDQDLGKTEDGDRKTCEYIVDWGDGMNRDVSFCGTPATKRYPHCRGFMYLCDEHSIKHLNYAEEIQ